MFSLWYFSLYSHWSLRFGLRSLCFALCFSKQKSSSSDRRFHWRILRGIFPVKVTRKWRQLFVWILLHCNLFVMRYIFWLTIIYIYICIYIYIWTRNQYVYVLQNNSKTKNTTFVWRIFVYMYTEGVFEVAVESWPEWDLNPRPLNTESLSDALTDGAMRPWVQLALRANFVQVLQFHLLFSVLFHFGYCLLQSPRLFELKVFWGNHMSVAAWVDTYGIHHWRIL